MIHNIHNCTSCVYISVQFDVQKHAAFMVHITMWRCTMQCMQKSQPIDRDKGDRGIHLEVGRVGGRHLGTVQLRTNAP